MSYSEYNLSRRAQRRLMAQDAGPTISPATTYAGELADFFVTPALKAADTLTKDVVTQLDGISNKAVVTGASVTDPLQESACEWNDGDDVTVDERVLTLKDMMVNQALCRGTILPTWNSVKGTRNSDWASPEFRNFVLATVAAKTAESVENAIWGGKDFTGTNVVGFLSNDGTIEADGFGSSILSGATTVAITAPTAANVLAQFALVHKTAATTKPAILTKADIAFYVGPDVFAFYQQALAGVGASDATNGLIGQGVNNLGTLQALSTLNYLGIPVHRCPGITDDVIVLGAKSNLFVGSNLRTDYTQVQYIPYYQYDGSDNVRVTMRFGLGMQVGTPADVIVGADFIT